MSQCTDDGVVITSKSEIHATEEDKKPDNIVTKVDQKILNDERDSKQVFITGNKIESNKEMMSTEPQTTRKSINNSNVSPLTTDNNTQTDWHTMLVRISILLPYFKVTKNFRKFYKIITLGTNTEETFSQFHSNVRLHKPKRGTAFNEHNLVFKLVVRSQLNSDDIPVMFRK